MDAWVESSGAVHFHPWGKDYDEDAHRWASITELAADEWQWQRLSNRKKDRLPMTTYNCIGELMRRPDSQAAEVIQALLDLAADDDEVVLVGAGPLEDLVSHFGHGSLVIDEVERRARQQPRFRRAVAALYLGDDIPEAVRTRLEAFRPPR